MRLEGGEANEHIADSRLWMPRFKSGLFKVVVASWSTVGIGEMTKERASVS